jgi:hypothetical protein
MADLFCWKIHVHVWDMLTGEETPLSLGVHRYHVKSKATPSLLAAQHREYTQARGLAWTPVNTFVPNNFVVF